MQEQETSAMLRDHYSGLAGFDDDFASEVELTEEEFKRMQAGELVSSVNREMQ